VGGIFASMMPIKMTARGRIKLVCLHPEIAGSTKKKSHRRFSCGSHDEAALLLRLSQTLFTFLLPARTVGADARISFFIIEPISDWFFI
jgi:hypothetical protein